jgi:2-methylisocitrate lyase-like PEP mutase family enzyme
LRELVTRKEKMLSVMHFPTAHLARTMELGGAEAGFVGTAGVVGNMTGMADLGQISMTEVLQVSKWISRSVNVPVIMDGDNGHGGIMSIRRMVREAIEGGVSGIRIDDRAIEVDKEESTGMGSVVPLEFALTRFRAALDMRDEMRRPDFFIIGQCITRPAPNGGLEEALMRMPLYEKTGVDIVQFRNAETVDEVRQARSVISGPLSIELLRGGTVLSLDEQLKLGLQMAWFPGYVHGVINRALYGFMKDFSQRGVEAWDEFAKAYPENPPRFDVQESGAKQHELEKRYFG